MEPELVIAATADGSWRMEVVPAWGGVLNRLIYTAPGCAPVDLLAGNADAAAFQADRYFRGAPLYPWVNRLDGGRYRLGDRAFQFSVNEAGTNTSLHGFLYRLQPRVTACVEAAHAAAITLQYDYAGANPGYPFPARIGLRYEVQRDAGLAVRFSVCNLHEAPVPVGCGWHPYFTLGLPVDALLLQLPSARRVLVNERLLPTGEKQAFRDFATLTRIGDWRVDSSFLLDAAPGQRACTRLWSATQNRGIELWQHAADFPYLHVFIPPDRQSIALEPVSSGIDAFNTGEHLRMLAPGATFEASCGLHVLQSEPA
jgi:aldose 1-epimerase